MTFEEILDQAVAMLRRRGQMTYRTLKRQFDLDDEVLEDLKDELLYSHSIRDDDGRGLVWTDEADSQSESDVRREADSEVRFNTLLRAAIGLLWSEKRVTYRELKHTFDIDDDLLAEIRQDLVLKRLVMDEKGKVLVWIGEAQPSISPPESLTTDTSHDESTITPTPIHNASVAERRQLTVMFCDLADSTTLSQQLDAEDLRDVIRAYQETAAEVIHQYDGHMAQYLGDGLLVYFGWPVAHEDDAQRAMYAGLGIIEAITTTLNPCLEQEKGVQLTVRIGVHTGPVVVGEMGGGGRNENLATGETVNIAARLEGLAQTNTMLISDVTARLTRDAFALEDLGPKVLKGVVEPIDVFQVIRQLDTDHDDERRPDGDVFLVGRDEEVGLLLRRWEQAKEGLGQVVLISGEAGIGKSSLVAMVRHYVGAEGYTRITFRCSPYHTNSALYPLITHLEQMLDFDREDNSEAKLNKLEQALRTTNLSVEESVPLLSGLLSVPFEDRYPASTFSSQQQRQQTLDTLVAWLIEEAERQPTLIMWEDLHWADPSTLELLGLMVDQSPTAAILNLLTFRPEFEPLWNSRSHLTPITLNRLERLQVEALILHLSDDKALPLEVVEHIVTKTDGVPLFVEELTKMLLESDVLRQTADHYTLAGTLDSAMIPTTLQDSLMARLDRLSEAREVAQLGSVIGRMFSYDMLQPLVRLDEAALQAQLAQLVAADLLYQRGRPPRSTYIFKHALVQDAAYQSLLRRTRQQTHQHIAQALEERFPEMVEQQPELLAYHCAAAEEHERAVDYGYKAGQRAVQRSANLEAIGHYTESLERLRYLPEMPQNQQRELNVQIALGMVLMATKGFTAPEAAHAFTRALELCQELDETSQRFAALRGLWNFHLVRGDLLTAQEIATQCVTTAQSTPESGNGVEASWTLGVTLLFRGVFKPALAHLEQGLALSESEPQPANIAQALQHPAVGCLMYTASTLWFLGYPDQALARAEQAIDLAEQLSHPYSMVWSRYHAVYVHQYRRDVQLALEQLDAVMAGEHDHGFNFLRAREPLIRGWALVMQGEVEQGLALLRQGYDAYRHLNAGVMTPVRLSQLAEAYLKSGQSEEGLAVLTEALASLEQTDARFYEAEVHRLKGELILKRSLDHHIEAETCFHQAISVARRQQAKSWELRAATSLARLWQSQGKRQEAYELLAPVYGWFTEGFDTTDLKDAKALLEALG